MEIELINTGSELMLGRVLNTHQQWLCAQLANRGWIVTRQIAVADEATAIQNAVRESLARAELIITTGGLGPTSDDLTRDLIAGLLGKKLEMNQETLQRIENFFAERKRRMPENTSVQALVPEGAIVLQNENGTAPGLIIETKPVVSRSGKQWLVMLPGPPRELRPMFSHQVIPLLQKYFPAKKNFVCRTLKTTGLGESLVEEKLSEQVRKFSESGVEIGYCARVGEVDVRLLSRKPNAATAIASAEKIIREILGQRVFGEEEDSLEAVVVRELIQHRKTLTLAESCTGGFIAHRMTNVPGASAIFINGFVTYSNESKQRLLGVREKTLAQHGAVSEATVREMAEGARAKSQTDFALAVTGIAGPGGGSEEKPVGTAFIGLATESRTIVQHHVFRYDRETFKFVTSQTALDLLRSEISVSKS
ncbi:MAG: competence/damage-inducible protein A [Verrucomicrobiota bacterium]